MFLGAHEFAADDLKNLEAILMLRVLENLGYFGSHEQLGEFVADTPWTGNFILSMGPKRRDAVLAINNALRESNL